MARRSCGHAAMHAAVEGVAHHGVADGRQVDTDLMRAAGVNRDLRQGQRAQDFGAHDARHGLAAAPGPRGHLLAVRRIAPDGRVDSPARLDETPDEREVVFFHLAVVKLPRELFVRRVILRHDHQS